MVNPVAARSPRRSSPALRFAGLDLVGRNFAIGGNEYAADTTGVPVGQLIKVAVYMISGPFYMGFRWIIQTGWLGAGRQHRAGMTNIAGASSAVPIWPAGSALLAR